VVKNAVMIMLAYYSWISAHNYA